MVAHSFKILQAQGGGAEFSEGRLALSLFKSLKNVSTASLDANRILANKIAQQIARKVALRQHAGSDSIEYAHWLGVLKEHLKDSDLLEPALRGKMLEPLDAKLKKKGLSFRYNKKHTLDTDQWLRLFDDYQKRYEFSGQIDRNSLLAAVLCGGTEAFLNSLIEAHVNLARAGQNGALDIAKALLIELVFLKRYGVSLLTDGSAVLNNEIGLALSRLGLATQSGASWKNSFFIKILNHDCVKLLFRVEFSGIAYLYGIGLKSLFFIERFALLALELASTQKDALDVFEAQLNSRLVFSESFLKPLGGESSCCQEWGIRISDSLEGIFQSLSVVANVSKLGGSISVDLNALRATGAAVGELGHRSGGVLPVLKLLAETVSMLALPGYEKMHVRVFLDIWHPDWESFIRFSETAPKEMRFAIGLPDCFMKTVASGGVWHYAPAAHCQRLALKRGKALEEDLLSGDGLSEPAGGALDRLVSSVAKTKKTSLIFTDVLFNYDQLDEKPLLGPRLAAFVTPSRPDTLQGVIEAGLCIDHLSPKQASSLMLLTARVLTKRLRVENTLGFSAHYSIGLCGKAIKPEDLLETLSALAQKTLKQKKQNKGVQSFWAAGNPQRSKIDFLRKERGGLLTVKPMPMLTVFPPNGDPSIRLALSSREECLWITGGRPVFLNDSEFSVIPQFGPSHGPIPTPIEKKGAALSDLIERVGQWQSVVEQSISWDCIGVTGGGDKIKAIIQKAWVSGVAAIRRI